MRSRIRAHSVKELTEQPYDFLDAPVDNIQWAGLPGKTPNLIRRNEAWSVDCGDADGDSRRWASSCRAEDVLKAHRFE